MKTAKKTTRRMTKILSGLRSVVSCRTASFTAAMATAVILAAVTEVLISGNTTIDCTTSLYGTYVVQKTYGFDKVYRIPSGSNVKIISATIAYDTSRPELAEETDHAGALGVFYVEQGATSTLEDCGISQSKTIT